MLLPRKAILGALLVLLALIAAGVTPVLATIDLKEAASASKPEDLQEVGKQLNNPVSSIWNITTQSNMTFLKGDLSPAAGGSSPSTSSRCCPSLSLAVGT